MADLPVPFTAPMVRAIIEGRKTQTRRGNHLNRLRRFGNITEFSRSSTLGYAWHFRDKEMRWHELTHQELLKVLPWHVGDRLYVREAWRSDTRNDGIKPSDIKTTEPIWYEADIRNKNVSMFSIRSSRLRPGMFMPRWASRITLEVTDVRVERLQDIREADALAEGIVNFPPGSKHWGVEIEKNDFGIVQPSPIEAYAWLWDHINGEGAWDKNPWVSAYTFKAAFANIDTLKQVNHG